MTGANARRRNVDVSAVATLASGASAGLVFRVSDRSGSDKFFDIVIEGISLLSSERVEIGALLDQRGGDIDRLTRDLTTDEVMNSLTW